MTGTLKASSGMPPLVVTASISIFARQYGALSIKQYVVGLEAGDSYQVLFHST